MPNVTGVIIYDGPSRITRDRIVTVLTFDSANPKTGGMAQTTTLRTDMRPMLAQRCGADVAMCGFCPQRPALGGGCYVNPMVIASIWRKLQDEAALKIGRSSYLQASLQALPEMFAGWYIRVGTYGDPAAVPYRVWEHLLRHVAGWTGYTHLWRDYPDFKDFCMASVDTPAEWEEAKSLGWRTFRTRPKGSMLPLMPREINCPASVEGGKRTQCWRCLLCGGTSGRLGPDVVIRSHGPRAGKSKTLGGLSYLGGLYHDIGRCHG